MTLDYQNLAYALTQVAHNFGAVAGVGGAAYALTGDGPAAQRKLAWLVLSGWIVQVLSGATFGAISYYYYASFPDLFGIAVGALVVKVACAVLGICLAGWQLLAPPQLPSRRYIWAALCVLGALALMCAAFLRWFS
jgi:hypothetical protein